MFSPLTTEYLRVGNVVQVLNGVCTVMRKSFLYCSNVRGMAPRTLAKKKKKDSSYTFCFSDTLDCGDSWQALIKCQPLGEPKTFILIFKDFCVDFSLC